MSVGNFTDEAQSNLVLMIDYERNLRLRSGVRHKTMDRRMLHRHDNRDSRVALCMMRRIASSVLRRP